MSSDPFRQPFEGSVASRLNARWNVHRQALRSEMSTPEHKMRLPVWAELSKAGTDLEIDMGQEYLSFGERYDQTTYRPKVPSLTQVTITRDAGRGYSINLALTITVEFEVYTYEQFNEYAREYLRRDPHNPIKLEWGNVNTYSGRGLLKHTLGGMYIVSGGYTTTPSNTYICSFKAIAGAEAVKGFDIFKVGSLVERFKDPNNEINGQSVGSTSTHRVNGLADIVNLHMLYSGDTSITDGRDGYEVANTSPAMSEYLKSGVIGKIYTPTPEIEPNTEWTKGNTSSGDKGSVSQKLEYVTLEYIVALLQVGVIDYYNDDLAYKSNESQGSKYTLTFADTEEEGISYSSIPQPVPFPFKSCIPRDILFLGEKSGTYLTTTGRGKDFEIGLSEGLKAVKREGGAYKINHRKILISKAFLVHLLVDAITSTNSANQKLEESEIGDSANKVTEKRLGIRTLLTSIFKMISAASGGLVNLSLQMDRKTQDSVSNISTKPSNTMLIVDSNYNSKGGGDIKVWEFDPLLGDGNLLNLQLKADLARDLLDVALWQNTKTGSGTTNKQSGPLGLGQIQLQAIQCAAAAGLLQDTDEREGLWTQFITTGFNAEKSAAIASKFEELGVCASNAEALNEGQPAINGFMPVRLTADMEGIFPIKIGNLFTSTNLPEHQKLKKNGIAIVCTQVTDTISKPGVWTTQIQGMMTAIPKSTPLLNQADISGGSLDNASRLDEALTSTQNLLNRNPFGQPLTDILGNPR